MSPPRIVARLANERPRRPEALRLLRSAIVDMGAPESRSGWSNLSLSADKIDRGQAAASGLVRPHPYDPGMPQKIGRTERLLLRAGSQILALLPKRSGQFRLAHAYFHRRRPAPGQMLTLRM